MEDMGHDGPWGHIQAMAMRNRPMKEGCKSIIPVSLHFLVAVDSGTVGGGGQAEEEKEQGLEGLVADRGGCGKEDKIRTQRRPTRWLKQDQGGKQNREAAGNKRSIWKLEGCGLADMEEIIK